MSSSTILSKRRRAVGFTLVELMVVIVLIGLLAGVVTIQTRSYLLAGKKSVAKVELSKISQALDTFYTAFDRYPTTEEGLEVLTQENDTFEGGLLSKLPRDPWRNRYEYVQPGRESAYEIICYGADGREGGEGADADISSCDLDPEESRSDSP